MRRLIYIPAWHIRFSKDLATDAALRLKNESIDVEGMDFRGLKYWAKVRSALDDEDVDITKARIYSDSAYLPWDEMRPYFQKEADDGVPEGKILLELIDRGAHYEVTEDLELLLRQVRSSELISKVASEIEPIWQHGQFIESDEPEEIKRRFQTLTNRMGTLIKIGQKISIERDKEVASRINQSLQNGETGILIMGADHRVSIFLDEVIEFKPLREEFVELTNGDSGKREIAPRLEDEGAGLEERS